MLFRVPQECKVLPCPPKVNARLRYLILISEFNYLYLLGNRGRSASCAKTGNLPSTGLLIHESSRDHLRRKPKDRQASLPSAQCSPASGAPWHWRGSMGGCTAITEPRPEGLRMAGAALTHDHSHLGEKKGLEIINPTAVSLLGSEASSFNSTWAGRCLDANNLP